MDIAAWITERCPGCGRDVCFLPGQAQNRCGWCGTEVRRGLE